MAKKLARGLLILVGVLAVFFVGLFFAMSVADSPGFALRVLRHGESDIRDYEIFPERQALNSSAISPLPTAELAVPAEVEYRGADGSRLYRLDELLSETGTLAFLVIVDDHLVYEKYLDSNREDVHTSFSSAKSFDSALIGAAIADGYIKSVDEPVVKFVPEIAGRGLDEFTIRDLLLMNSGIRYVEGGEVPFFKAPFADDALTYYSPDLRRIALSVQASGAPIGEAFHYNNYHPLLEGLIIERATGMNVAEYLQERLWKPMGAEFPASWSLDSESSGFEKMESGINARAVDYARFGLVFLHKGRWNGEQILPEDWVEESTRPLEPDPRVWETMREWPDQGGYYKYHWWGIHNPDGSYDFYSHGKYDQIVYVAPRKNAVIVRLGDAFDGQPSGLWALVMRDLVDRLP